MLIRACIALVAALAACSVDRKSDALRCTDSSQCSGGRTCVQSYCIEDANCPMGCASCDPGTSPPSCIVPAGTGGGSFNCPPDTHCDITCPTPGSCGNIHCNGECSITCIGTNSCGSITCTDGRCMIACNGDNACESVTCSGACACDVVCTGTCDAVSCPRAQGKYCTSTGASGPACVSTMPGCDRC